MKNNKFQEKFLLTLCEDNRNTQIVKTILKSPLGLAQEIIRLLITSLEKSDDLWLAYVIASLGSEDIELKGINNIQYLDELLKTEKFDISGFTSNEKYLKIANELALKIIPKWNKDSLPVSTMSEKTHYIYY